MELTLSLRPKPLSIDGAPPEKYIVQKLVYQSGIQWALIKSSKRGVREGIWINTTTMKKEIPPKQ